MVGAAGRRSELASAGAGARCVRPKDKAESPRRGASSWGSLGPPDTAPLDVTSTPIIVVVDCPRPAARQFHLPECKG